MRHCEDCKHMSMLDGFCRHHSRQTMNKDTCPDFAEYKASCDGCTDCTCDEPGGSSDTRTQLEWIRDYLLDDGTAVTVRFEHDDVSQHMWARWTFEGEGYEMCAVSAGGWPNPLAPDSLVAMRVGSGQRQRFTRIPSTLRHNLAIPPDLRVIGSTNREFKLHYQYLLDKGGK